MASLTYQQYNTKTLSGLSDTYSNNINCDTITIANNLTCSPGCVITLPPASIQDSYLSANVAFRNQVNSFTLTNNFASTTNFNGTVNTNVNSNINNGSILFFVATNSTQTRLQQTTTSFQIVNQNNSQSIILSSRTSAGTPVTGVQCQNGNSAFLQGDINNRVTVSGSSTPTINTQAPTLSNDLSIANTAWVVSQAYAKLAGPQTFTGNQNFPTQATSDNSTLASTTAFVKNQNYITAAALSGYALLAGPQTFTGNQNFPTQATSDNSTLAATTAFVKNQGYAVLGTSNTFLGLNNQFRSNSVNLPISIQNTAVPTYGGGMFIVSTVGPYNAINQNGDTVLLSTGTGALNTGALSLTTWSSTNCGIRITNNTINIIGGTTLTTTATTHNNTATNYNISGVCSFTNTTTPVITQAISLSDNSTKIATTAFVKGQNYITTAALSGYALLAGPQTFTGNQNFPTPATSDNNTLAATTAFVKNQNYITSSALTPYALLNPSSTQTFAGTGVQSFTNTALFTNGLDSNSNITCYSGALSSNIKQNTLGLEITNVDTSKYIKLITRTSAGANVANITCENGNNTTIQGSLTMANDAITCKDVLGGASFTQVYQTGSEFVIVPNHSSSQVSIFTKTSGGTSVENIRCTNGITNLVRGSISMLNDGIVYNDVGGGANNTSMYQTGITCTISNNYNNGSVRLNTKDSSGNSQDGVYALDGNRAGLQGNTNKTIEVNGNDCTIACDNFKSNAPFECGYLQLAPPITAKTNYDIGYIWSIQGSSFTSWNGFTSYGNVVTIVWDGSGDKTLGVWKVDICIATNTTSAMDSGFVLNTTNTFVINTRSAWSNALTSYGVNQAQIVRLSTTLEITDLTTTYYLNFKINGGASRTDVPGGSQMLFTRIA